MMKLYGSINISHSSKIMVSAKVISKIKKM